MIMDLSRAQEILKMEQTIQVKHEGVEVWIDSVDSSNSRAMVHDKNNPSSRMQVPVQALQEA